MTIEYECSECGWVFDVDFADSAVCPLCGSEETMTQVFGEQ